MVFTSIGKPLEASRGATEIHLAFVVDSHVFSGAVVYVKLLLRHLSRNIQRSLIVSAPVASYFEEFRACCTNFIVVPTAEGREAAPEVAAILESIKPDLSLVNLIEPRFNQAHLAAATESSACIATLHLDSEHVVGRDREELSRQYRRLRNIIAVSKPVAAQLRSNFDVPADRIIQIRNGVDIPPQPAARREPGPLKIGVVARLSDQKGIDILLSAVSDITRRRHDFSVLIAGDGPQRAALERQALGLPVKFLGLRQDIPALLREIDIFCLPSRSEGLPLALLEAMGHGLPCVATPVGDIADAVGNDAFLVEPENPQALARILNHLMSDSLTRDALGSRARARAMRDFSVRRMVNETEEVIFCATGNLKGHET